VLEQMGYRFEVTSADIDENEKKEAVGVDIPAAGKFRVLAACEACQGVDVAVYLLVFLAAVTTISNRAIINSTISVA